MTAIDYVFLAACVLALALMLIGSKVMRAIFWETVRHPFRPSRIEVHQGQVVIAHTQPVSAEGAQPRSPAGAR
jgi:hypothetical protein